MVDKAVEDFKDVQEVKEQEVKDTAKVAAAGKPKEDAIIAKGRAIYEELSEDERSRIGAGRGALDIIGIYGIDGVMSSSRTTNKATKMAEVKTCIKPLGVVIRSNVDGLEVPDTDVMKKDISLLEVQNGFANHTIHTMKKGEERFITYVELAMLSFQPQYASIFNFNGKENAVVVGSKRDKFIESKQPSDFTIAPNWVQKNKPEGFDTFKLTTQAADLENPMFEKLSRFKAELATVKASSTRNLSPEEKAEAKRLREEKKRLEDERRIPPTACVSLEVANILKASGVNPVLGTGKPAVAAKAPKEHKESAKKAAKK